MGHPPLCSSRLCSLSVAALLGFCAIAAADEVQVRRRTYANAKIVGMDQGRLRFRSADGALQTAWLDDVDLLAVDRGGLFADFNEAERLFAGGEFEKALNRYRRMLRLTEDFWQDLVPARMLIAADRGGQIDSATDSLVRVERGRWGGPALAMRLLPNNLPNKPNGKAARAIDALDAAIGRDGADAPRVPLLLARYDLLRAVGDERSRTEAERVAAVVIPEAQRCERAFTVVLAALQQTTEHSPQPTVLRDLDQAIGTCPETMLPPFLLLKGSVLSKSAGSREDWIRASWPFLRVGVHFSDHPLAAEGWLGAAKSLERIGRVEQAVELLKECLAVKRGAESVGTEAEAALRRLQSGSTGKD